jgi:hypothetical protein
MAQVNKIVSISGNTLSLERPLYINYSNSPAYNTMTPAFQSGVENLQVIGTAQAPNDGTAPRASTFFQLNGCDQAWFKNVRTVSSPSSASCYAHYMVRDSYACEWRQCYVEGSGNNPSGSNYGIYFTNNTSECLAEDNIGYRLRHSWIHAGGDSGNVFSYNYSLANWESDSGANWMAPDESGHGAETWMNLHEGNNVNQLNCDSVHGGDCFNTFFREWNRAYSSGTPTPSGNNRPVIFWEMSYQDNLIGCVLGAPGLTYVPSYAPLSVVSKNGLTATPYIASNYDLIGKATVGDPASLSLPASLLYSAKPSWWPTGIKWPIIGPDLDPMNGMNPAETRYKSGNY